MKRSRLFGRKPEVEAAGAVVWRAGPRGDVEVVLVHRPRYDDWSFPKGKLLPGETLEEAAVREVEEETGFRCRRGEVIGNHRYRDHLGRTKEVTYWLMEPVGGRFGPSAEVDQLRWVSLEEATRELTYDRDREMVRIGLGRRFDRSSADARNPGPSAPAGARWARGSDPRTGSGSTDG